MNSNYKEALNFWNKAYTMDEELKNQYKQEVEDPENDWKEIAPAYKLRDIIIEKLSNKKRVLDYGCGDGWASVILNKAGCEDVTCVDVVENAIEMVSFNMELFNIKSGIFAQCVTNDWIATTKADDFNGLFCSNVIDVVPETVANDIIKNIDRITTKDASIIISMNHYEKPVNVPEKNIEIKNGNELYVNGILRMVTRTDEEWTKIFEQYFKVEGIEYFAWPGETVEKRRIFILKK